MIGSFNSSLLLLTTFLLPFLLVNAASHRSFLDDDDLTVERIIQCFQIESQPSIFGPFKYPISDFIYTRKNSSFLDVLNWRANNLRYQKNYTWKPLLIVTAKEETAIPAIVRCARIHGLKIRIRSGGHDFEGLSFKAPEGERFMVLDMYNLNEVRVDVEDESAWVQAGATLGQIYHGIAEKSGVHAFPAGICPTVGSGGHISGGGYGALMRKYGLSVDNVVDARIVDVTGRIMDRKEMGEDLFWAIRGGGGSSFGVILAWKLKLVRVPRNVTVFNVEIDVLNNPGANHILYKWQEVAPKLPKELFLRIETKVSPNSAGNLTIQASFLALFLGDKETAVDIMSQSLPELGLKVEDCIEKPWIESVLFWHHFPEGTSRDILLEYDIRYSAYRKIKGDFVKRPIPESALPLLWDKVKEFGSDVGTLYMEWSPYGGRMDEIDDFALPYPHRKGNLYMIFYDAMWYDDSISEYYMSKSRELYDLMTPYVSDSPREALLNYVDLDIEDSGVQYFGKNFLKLVMVKTRVDPTDFFSHEQSIPTLDKLETKRSNGSYNNVLRLPK